MSGIINAELFAAMLRVATPLLLVALGGLMCQRAEIFNIGIEGYMLMGAFFAIFFIDRFGNSWMGLIGGILGGTGLCMVYALFVIKFKANHILTSIAVNYLSTGLTTFLLIPIYGVKGGYRPEHMEMLPTVDIPFVEEIPFVGKVLSGHTVTVYLGLALIVITWFILFKTPFGMLVRSVGSNPDAVRTAGVRPETVQFLVILWCGILCGLAGAHLSTGYASEFTENITQGRGFTAFSAIVFGGGAPGLLLPGLPGVWACRCDRHPLRAGQRGRFALDHQNVSLCARYHCTRGEFLGSYKTQKLVDRAILTKKEL